MYYVLCNMYSSTVAFRFLRKLTTALFNSVAAKLDVERKICINDRNQACGGPINFNAALFN